MCSEPSSTAAAPQPSTADRIVDAACARIADCGAAEATVRAVAADAGVSPALVIHHFGSKDGLVAACDRRVTAAIDAVFDPLRGGASPETVEGGWVELLRSTPYLGYITRSIRDGGDLGRRLFDELYEMSLQADASMRELGVARPTPDPQMRALLLMALDMGMLLMAEHIERCLGSPLDEPATAQRWVSGVVELLTHGLFSPSAPIPEESP